MGRSTPLVAVDELDERGRLALAEILRGHEDGCGADAAPPPLEALAALLPPEGEALRGRALVELVKRDQRQAWQAGNPRMLEDYLQAWPELRASVRAIEELLESECRCRALHGDPPRAEELATRFPEHSRTLELETIIQNEMPSWSGEAFTGNDRFRVLRRIGAGGMGVVYEAFDREHDARVALKTLPHAKPVALYRFKREFRLLTELTHPNLVRLYELFSTDDQWFFTMEIVDGIDFLRWVRPGFEPPEDADDPPTGTLDTDRLRAALAQLAEGVAALHEEGKLHRDLKPSNVLVCGDGRVVVLDFGLVTELGEGPEPGESSADGSGSRSGSGSGSATTHLGLVGTIPYMSPEQAKSSEALTPACDWYSIGVMLYGALTGSPLFTGTDVNVLVAKQTRDPERPSDKADGIPEDLDALCMHLLRRDPAERAGIDEVRAVTGDRAPRPARPTSARLAATAPTAPLVGREPHLLTLRAAFDRMAAGRAVTCHVHGRSGNGKTTLVQHFCNELAEREDVVLLSGRCYEQESVPYKALDSLIDSLSRYLLRLPPEEAEALLPADIRWLSRVFPVLRRIEAVERAAAPADIADVQESRRRAFAALRALLRAIGERAPLVLLIDDLQWGDLDSASVLSELVRPPDPPRLLLLVSYRSEDAERSVCLTALKQAEQKFAGPRHGEDAPESRHFEEVEVLPLSPGDARALALQLLGDERKGARVVADQIARESRGSPYFIIELVQHMSAGADISHIPSDSAGGEGIDLDEALRARVRALPEHARRLLEILAVAGRPLRQREACHAAALGTQQQQAVRDLRGGHFVRTTGPGLDEEIETYHDRIREGIARHLSADELRTHHRRLALSLESFGAEDAEALAVHFDGAGMSEKAGHYQAIAADQAARAFAFDRAAKLYRLALKNRPAAAEDGAHALRVNLADALANAGRGLEAAREFQTACGSATDANEWVELQRRAGYQYCVGGYVDEGRGAFERAFGRAGIRWPKTPARALVGLLARQAWLRVRGRAFRERPASEIAPEELARIDLSWSAATALTMIDPVRGAYFVNMNLTLALRAGEPYRVARALALEAVHVGGTGPGEQARRLLEEAEALARRVDSTHALGLTRLCDALVSFSLGDWDRSKALCEEAGETLRRCTGATWERDTANVVALFAMLNLGLVEERRQRTALLLEEAEGRGDLYAATTLGSYHKSVSRIGIDDDPVGARSELEGWIDRWSHDGFHMQHATGLMANVYIDLYAGEGVAAFERIREKWAPLRRSLLMRMHSVRINVFNLRAHAAIAASTQVDDPRRYLRSARADVRRLRRERFAWAHALADMLDANILAASGQADAALDALRVAIASLEKVKLRYFLMCAQGRIAQLVSGPEGDAAREKYLEWNRAAFTGKPGRLARMYSYGWERQSPFPIDQENS